MQAITLHFLVAWGKPNWKHQLCNTLKLPSKVIHSFIHSFIFFWVSFFCGFYPSFLSKLWRFYCSCCFTRLHISGKCSSHDFISHFSVIQDSKRLEFAHWGPICSITPTSSLWQVKDIHDFDGVHGDWLKHAAVTLVVHHHHEEIAAGDLLDHKGPANHSTDSQKQRRGRKEGGRGSKGGVWAGLASRQGAWVWCKFPCVSEDLCYECLCSPLVGGGVSSPEETPVDACQEDDYAASCQ